MPVLRVPAAALRASFRVVGNQSAVEVPGQLGMGAVRRAGQNLLLNADGKLMADVGEASGDERRLRGVDEAAAVQTCRVRQHRQAQRLPPINELSGAASGDPEPARDLAGHSELSSLSEAGDGLTIGTETSVVSGQGLILDAVSHRRRQQGLEPAGP
ncbi:MAG: hypothetical protein E6Z28_03450 [Actinomyces urogenitalis]|nr:hypothetical protein [Actinomyces urogenitalis]MDU5874073.1 hypothetical protein [Actinomyces urogenitalis]